MTSRPLLYKRFLVGTLCVHKDPSLVAVVLAYIYLTGFAAAFVFLYAHVVL